MKTKIHFLESLRGLAAIYVLIYHCRWLLTESYSNRESQTINTEYIITKIFIIFRFGHEAVIFFFVLSGFVIHYSTIKTGVVSLDFIAYLKKRINRILPPLIFALLLTLLFDCIGKYFFNFNVYINGSKYYELIVDNLNFKSFAANLLSLQELNLGIKHFGSNSVLWSLSYEWWFYLFYPAFFLLNKNYKIITLLLLLLLYLSTAFIIPVSIPILTPIFSKMLIWWFGVVIANLYFKNKKILPYITLLLLSIPVAIIFYPDNRLIGDVFWGLGFAGLLATLLSLNPLSFIIKALNKISAIGNYSYTLYLIHFPIIYIIYAYLIDHYKDKLPTSYVYLLIVVPVCISLSKLIAPTIEKIRILKP